MQATLDHVLDGQAGGVSSRLLGHTFHHLVSKLCIIVVDGANIVQVRPWEVPVGLVAGEVVEYQYAEGSGFRCLWLLQCGVNEP